MCCKKDSNEENEKCGCCCDCGCDCGCCDCCECCIEVGDEVPDFELECWCPRKGDFDAVSLKALKEAGKWTVVVFFPAAFTPVCPTELAEIAERYKEISDLGAEVVVVSEDTKFVLQAWAQSEPLLKDVKYPLASDVKGEAAKLFGVYDYKTGLALRGTFIISPAGTLVSSEVSFYNVARSAAELLRKLEANVYVTENPGEACPAKWSKK